MAEPAAPAPPAHPAPVVAGAFVPAVQAADNIPHPPPPPPHNTPAPPPAAAPDQPDPAVTVYVPLSVVRILYNTTIIPPAHPHPPPPLVKLPVEPQTVPFEPVPPAALNTLVQL